MDYHTEPESAKYEALHFEHYTDVFRTGNYERATIRQRMNAYQALEHDTALQEGRPERQVVFQDMSPDNLGYYSGKSDTLTLSSDYLKADADQFDGMNTVLHEGRHAYQEDCKNGKCQPDAQLKDHLDSMKVEDMIDPQSGNSVYDVRYDRNVSELDANQFANEKMHQFDSVFENDEGFQRTCKANDLYFADWKTEMQSEADQEIKANEQAKANHYTNDTFDALKSADSHVEENAKSLGFSQEEIDAQKSAEMEPTLMQQSHYDFPQRDIRPDNHSMKESLQDLDSPGPGGGQSFQDPAQGNVAGQEGMQTNQALQQPEQDNTAGQQSAEQEGRVPQNDWQSMMAGEEPGAQSAGQPHYADADQTSGSEGARSGQNAIGSKTPDMQQGSEPEPKMDGGMSI